MRQANEGFGGASITAGHTRASTRRLATGSNEMELAAPAPPSPPGRAARLRAGALSQCGSAAAMASANGTFRGIERGLRLRLGAALAIASVDRGAPTAASIAAGGSGSTERLSGGLFENTSPAPLHSANLRFVDGSILALQIAVRLPQQPRPRNIRLGDPSSVVRLAWRCSRHRLLVSARPAARAPGAARRPRNPGRSRPAPGSAAAIQRNSLS